MTWLLGGLVVGDPSCCSSLYVFYFIGLGIRVHTGEAYSTGSNKGIIGSLTSVIMFGAYVSTYEAQGSKWL